jgi:hypothetical protein
MTSDTHTSRRSLAILASFLVAVTLVAAACSSGDDPGFDQAETDAVGEGQPFGGRFEDLPLPPRSDPLGTRSEQDGLVARSYQVEGSAAVDVMEFYRSALPDLGYEVLMEPRRSGTSTIQAEWTKGDLDLRVTATDATGLGGDTNPTGSVMTQYSLTLREA